MHPQVIPSIVAPIDSCSSLLYCIVLNWNDYEETIECVQSLLASDYTNSKIVIVDNASTNESVSILKSTFPEIDLIINSYNAGYAGGNNLGIKLALERKAEYILVLNNDVIVEPTMISELIKPLCSRPELGMVTGKVKYQEDGDRIFSGPSMFIRWRCSGVNRGTMVKKLYFTDRQCDINYTSGVLFMAKSEVFKSVNLLDEKYFMYFEDLEFSRRVHRKYAIAYVPTAVSYHKSGGGTTWSNYSDFYLYYHTRNRFMVFDHDNAIYQSYVILFSLAISIAKTLTIAVSYVRTGNKAAKKQIGSIWMGLKDGIIQYSIIKNLFA